MSPRNWVGGAALITRTQIRRQRHRIIIPVLPSDPGGDKGNSRGENEYRTNKLLSPHLSAFLDKSGAECLKRQQQLHCFREATESMVEQVWRDSKPHLRKQEQLVKELGVEGAVLETLTPSTISFRSMLRQRPLDRGILEEIYHGLHGRRIERKLKKGVSWEHWITKGDGTAPVFTTSKKAQQTFAFGGHIQQVRLATHPQQFPVILRANSGPDANHASKEVSAKQTRRARRKVQSDGQRLDLVDRDQLLPEVAFVGRTSSGKSSLVNALVNAMISPYGHLQGTTSSVRFYCVAQKIVLVDCPGYGYYNPLGTPPLDAENAVKAMRAYLKTGARASSLRHRPWSRTSHEDGTPSTLQSTTVQGVSTETEGNEVPHDRLTNGMLYQPRNIKRVFVCVSARGLQRTDLEYCDLLNRMGIPFSVILTKTDAAPIRFLARLADYTRSQLIHYEHCKELMLTSALRLAGIDKLQSLVASVAAPEDRFHGATNEFDAIV